MGIMAEEAAEEEVEPIATHPSEKFGPRKGVDDRSELSE